MERGQSAIRGKRGKGSRDRGIEGSRVADCGLAQESGGSHEQSAISGKENGQSAILAALSRSAFARWVYGSLAGPTRSGSPGSENPRHPAQQTRGWVAHKNSADGCNRQTRCTVGTDKLVCRCLVDDPTLLRLWSSKPRCYALTAQPARTKRVCGCHPREGQQAPDSATHLTSARPRSGRRPPARRLTPTTPAFPLEDKPPCCTHSCDGAGFKPAGRKGGFSVVLLTQLQPTPGEVKLRGGEQQ